MTRLAIYADSRGPGRCRSCGAAIEWAEVVASGRRMPFDGRLAPVESRQHPENGRVVEIVDLDATTSHFATCPDAARWRRRETGSRKETA